MKIKEFIKLDIDLDVYDDLCESLYIAFVGPLVLTDTGSKKFAKALECDIDIDKGVIHIGDSDDWKNILDNVTELFHAAAGYCGETNYAKWFVEEY